MVLRLKTRESRSLPVLPSLLSLIVRHVYKHKDIYIKLIYVLEFLKTVRKGGFFMLAKVSIILHDLFMKILKNAAVSSGEINVLMALCWDEFEDTDFDRILQHSLAYFTIRDDQNRLIGYCNLAWDGGRHASLFDLNIHPDFRHQGLAIKMIQQVKQVAIDNNIRFFHVDFDPTLEPLYKKAGFDMISAGLMLL